MTEQLEGIIKIAKSAGAAVLQVYEKEDFGVETKADNSPLTEADLAAHEIIISGLNELAPGVPILSEESEDIPYATRKKWQRYFLVDPLDGTKEFISRNGEFTVNIALIEEGIPVLGVVFVPVSDVTYAGQQLDTRIAFVERSGSRRDIATRNLPRRLRNNEALTVVASRRHGGEALQRCVDVLQEKFADVELINMGSSLKLCLVAEGKADLYPRLAPTAEWDTAAAQAVVEAAGGSVVDNNLRPLHYNSKESILNPFFYVIGDKSFAWDEILKEVEAHL
ncbi:MAG: 3'(2'),5'-bisphosphate nucleotidase CysQ [Proteobacteria bacterium]|nr:3'(2'),5'-bisphosphate nucleotidase CysQ [Pseudomonadota bacterium]